VDRIILSSHNLNYVVGFDRAFDDNIGLYANSIQATKQLNFMSSGSYSQKVISPLNLKAV